MVIVLAEKGMDSTAHRMPVQLQYRDENLRGEYQKNSEKFENSTTGPLKLKTISLKQIQMPLKYKLLHLFEPNPCKSAYHKIGWL